MDRHMRMVLQSRKQDNWGRNGVLKYSSTQQKHHDPERIAWTIHRFINAFCGYLKVQHIWIIPGRRAPS